MSKRFLPEDGKPGIDGPGPRLPDPADFLFLEQAQQLGLKRERKIANLVQKEGAGAGLLDQSGLVPQRAGERPARVPEQLALQEMVRDGPAVHGDKRTRAPPPAVVDGPGDELLARAALAVNEHRRGGVLDLGDERPDGLGGLAPADNPIGRNGNGRSGRGQPLDKVVLDDGQNGTAEEMARLEVSAGKRGGPVIAAETDGPHGTKPDNKGQAEHALAR